MTDPQIPGEPRPTPPSSATPPPSPPPAGAAQPAPGSAQQPPPGYAPPPAGYGPPAGSAPAGAPLTQEQDRMWSMWAHIGGIVGFLPSLIIWLIFKDRGPLVDREAKEALNWQITFTILMVAVYIVTGILGAILWILNLVLWILPLALWVLNIVFSVMGGLKVNDGGGYRYPMSFRFIA